MSKVKTLLGIGSTVLSLFFLVMVVKFTFGLYLTKLTAAEQGGRSGGGLLTHAAIILA
jgi:hypothetical protein